MKSSLYYKTDRFQFKKQTVPAFEGILTPTKPPATDEQLTGTVKGRKASDLEERFAIALDKFKIPYTFQRYIETDYTLPDQEKQLDFCVFWKDRAWPVEIYGSYWHSSAGDTYRDWERERQMNEIFKRLGWEELQIVWDYDLYNQAAANDKVRRMFA